MDRTVLNRRCAILAILVGGLTFASRALPQDPSNTNPYSGQPGVAGEGRSLFNIHCSHCHGPNAVQGERVRDLRRLFRRYGSDMPAVFFKTAMGGREEKGMPAWAGSLGPDTLWKIFTFIETVQKR